MTNVGGSYVQFIKQVPVHPRDRLARATKKAQSNDVQFVKQAPVHLEIDWQGPQKWHRAMTLRL